MKTPPDPRRRDDVRSALDRLLDLIADRIAERLAAERPPVEHRATEPGSNPTTRRKPSTKPEGK